MRARIMWVVMLLMLASVGAGCRGGRVMPDRPAVPGPALVGYRIGRDGAVAELRSTDIPAPAEGRVSCTYKEDRGYVRNDGRYRILVQVTNRDQWHAYVGRAVLQMGLADLTVDVPLAIRVGPLESVVEEYWAQPSSGKLLGCRLEGKFEAAWRPLPEGVPPFELVAATPGVGYVTVYVVTPATGDELWALAGMFEDRFRYEQKLGGYTVHVYAPADRTQALSKATEAARATFERNCQTGYNRWSGDEAVVPRHKTVLGFQYDAETGREEPIFGD